LKDGTNVSLVETISLAIGLPYSFFWCFLGWISVSSHTASDVTQGGEIRR